jgi:hypothetical protein
VINPAVTNTTPARPNAWTTVAMLRGYRVASLVTTSSPWAAALAGHRGQRLLVPPEQGAGGAALVAPKGDG